MKKNFNNNKKLKQNKMKAGARVGAIISEDGAMLNSGVFFISDTPWSRDFLTRVYVSLSLSLSPIHNTLTHTHTQIRIRDKPSDSTSMVGTGIDDVLVKL